MNVQQAIKHYGGKRKLADALNISPSAVTHWITAGKIPELHQYKLQALTGGKLKAGNGK
jgi:DNA-binding transcriptional regulator YdaS (Cro superfamily)